MNTKENVLARLSTGLNRERLTYKIYGIVAIVLAALIIVFGVIFAIAGSYFTADSVVTDLDSNGYTYEIDGYEVEITDGDVAMVAGAGIIAFSAFYITFGVILLAVGIVNLVMASKVGKYRLNPELTVKHAGSVGSIILAAFFNEIALIFVIINFVIAKKNRAVLEG